MVSSAPPVSDPLERRAAELQFPGPLYVALLWIPLLFLALGAKLYQAAELGALLGPASGLAVCGADLLFFALGFLAWVVLLRLRHPRARRAALVAFHVASPLIGALIAVDLAFFVISGTVGDWYLLKEGLKGFWALRKLYVSQMTPVRVAGLLAPWAGSAALFLIARRRRPRASALRFGSGRRALRVALSTSALVAILGLVGLCLPIPGQKQALRGTPIAELLADMGKDAFDAIVRRRRPASDSSSIASIDGPSSLVRSDQTRTRNVVLIVLESTGAAYTGLYGGPYDNTPNLKALAARGALLERAYTVMPHTSKSLVSMLCGFYPKLSPSIDEAKPQGIPKPCLPRLLRQQGYQTAFFQTAEENFELRADLVEQLGFAHFQGKESIDGRGYDESSYFGWEDDAMLPPIGRWLDEQGDKPFLLSVVTLTSHHPYNVPRGFPTRKYAAPKDLNDFLNTIAYLDRFVGKLVSELDKRGRLKDTMVVVVGDHGEGLGQHGRREHDAVPYEEGVHVPVVMIGPDIAPGTRVQGLRQLTDIAPTMAHALGFEGNIPFFGRDVFRDQPHDRLLVFCYYKDYCGDVIDADGTKIIYHFNRFPTELFRLPTDPDERHNLLSGPGVTSAMRTDVDAAVRQLVDTIKQDNVRYDMQGMVQTSLFVSRTPPPASGHAVNATFGDSVRVIEYNIDPPTIEPGGRTVISTTFQVLKTPPPTWNFFMHIDSPSESTNADHVPAEGTYPVSLWHAGDYVKDRFVFTTRPAATLDNYAIRIGFWDRTTGRRAHVEAQPPLTATADNRLQLGELSIKKAHVNVAEFVTSTPPAGATLDIQFGNVLRLVNSSIDRPVTKGGLKTTPSYEFQVLRNFGDRYELKVDLDGPTRRPLIHKPVYGEYPSNLWTAGQYIRDPHDIVTLTWDPLGTYRVLLSIVDKQTGKLLPVTGSGRPMPDQFHVQAAEYQLVR